MLQHHTDSVEEIFNTLVTRFIETKVGIADNFLSAALAKHLRENLAALYKNNLLQPAGTGSGTKPNQNSLVRSDIIYWLDRSHNDVHENNFLDLIDGFIVYLNENCYTGITGYEFHYTLYQEGSFYKKHVDQFQDNDSRKYSMIMYLNENWVKEDGGELQVHFADRTENIEPVNRKGVFFKSSELSHEVLINNKARMSITGWLKS